MSRFLETCLELLDITAPVHVRYAKAPLVELQGAMAEGWCESLPRGYSIHVATEGGFGKRVVLAHELVHVAVNESSPRAKAHGRKFQKMASYLEGALLERGYKLKHPLYDPRTDL